MFFTIAAVTKTLRQAHLLHTNAQRPIYRTAISHEVTTNSQKILLSIKKVWHLK